MENIEDHTARDCNDLELRLIGRRLIAVENTVNNLSIKVSSLEESQTKFYGEMRQSQTTFFEEIRQFMKHTQQRQ